jgi:8-oxo-dGTP diphosphatase
MWFTVKPADFNKRFDIVGCFIEHDGKFLLLHRHAHKANGGKWGLPAGKVDAGEERKQAVIREIEEETGLKFDESQVDYFDSRFVRHGDFDFEWHMFSTKLDASPDITIQPFEHSEFRWVTLDEALAMDTIPDNPKSFRLFYGE